LLSALCCHCLADWQHQASIIPGADAHIRFMLHASAEQGCFAAPGITSDSASQKYTAGNPNWVALVTALHLELLCA